MIIIHGAAMRSSPSGQKSSPVSSYAYLRLRLRRGDVEAGLHLHHRGPSSVVYPSTGLDVIDDMKTFFAFPASPDFNEKYLPAGLLDANRIAIIASGGGNVARVRQLPMLTPSSALPH